MKANHIRFALFIGSLTLFSLSTLSSAADLSLSDKRFLKNAAESGNYEVEGSKLALKTSKNVEVQKFAKMMVDDHTKAGAKLKALASSKGVDVSPEPSLVQQAKLKYLGTRNGAKFDDKYAETVGVSAHEATVKLFEDAADDASDADIKKFAADTLPTLKHHLELAKALDAKVDIDD